MSWLSRLVAGLSPQIKVHSLWDLRWINWRWRFTVSTSVFPCQYEATNVVLYITQTLKFWQSIASLNTTIQFILVLYSFLLLLFVSDLLSSFVSFRLASGSLYCLVFPLFRSVCFHFFLTTNNHGRCSLRISVPTSELRTCELRSIRAVSQFKPNSCSMYRQV
jgi:hypothetical protein